MKRTQKRPYGLSFRELLQELQTRTSTGMISTEEQQQIMPIMLDILQICAQAIVCPLLGVRYTGDSWVVACEEGVRSCGGGRA